MKIFGNTRIQGRVTADTGSFKKYGLMAVEQEAAVFIAGTDAPDILNKVENRSVVAHGLFDYIVTSQDSGVNFDSATTLSAGSVMGYRVQHVTPELIYSLRTQLATSYANPNKSSICVSRDGGVTFKNKYNPNPVFESRQDDDDPSAHRLPTNVIAFDMAWVSEDEGYVVGGKISQGPYYSPGDSVVWKKFGNFGRSISTGDVDTSVPVILKKEANSNDFVEWGTPPTSTANDAVTAIAIDPNNSRIIIIGTELGRLYRSTDGGLTWSDVGYLGASGTYVTRIKFVDGNSNVVYVIGANASILKSTSGGTNASWYKVQIDDSRGPLVVLTRDRRVPNFYDILLPNANDVIIVSDDHTRILKSSNAGSTWKYVSSGIYSDYLPIERVKSITIGLKNYYVCISRNKLFVTKSPNIMGGDSDLDSIDWYEINLPDEAIDLQLVKDEETDPNMVNGYAHILTKSGIYEFWINNYKLSRKQDFTTVTTEVPTKLFSHTYREIYIVTANSKIIRGTKYNYSFDNDFRFVEETSGLTSTDLISLHSARTGRIFAGSAVGDIIYKDTGSIDNETTYSTDPVTWTAATSPTGSASKVLQVQALDNSVVFALLEDNTSYQITLFKSTDNGTTWSQIHVYDEAIKNFVAYNENKIYAMNSYGSMFVYTTDGFSTVSNSILGVGESSDYPTTFELDEARSTDESSILFLLGGSFGVRASTMNIQYGIMGPWTDNSWALVAITGKNGYDFWIAGGTTFFPKLAIPGDRGSEPILLNSTDGGETWTNAISRIATEEPKLGDFMFTSISEGRFTVEGGNDVFNIYSSNDQGNKFEKKNSNLFLENEKYPGNLDGIQKIRFYDSKFGVAVGNIRNQNDSQAKCKVAITTDGGETWAFAPNAPVEYHFNSVFVTTHSIASDGSTQYEIYATAYPTDYNRDGWVFLSRDSGVTWVTSQGWKGVNVSPGDDRLTYQPLDIFFVDDKTGFVSIYGSINGTPTAEGVYRTQNAGEDWQLMPITDFAGGNTRGHLQFITKRKGYVAGTYGTSKNAGLFKTVDSGSSWSRITTPYDSTANKPVTAMHFLTEAVGVIGVGSEIWKTSDSGSNWSKVHDLKLTGKINEIKFSGNGKYGFAVGHYNSADSQTSGEHFVLRSTDSGSSWTELDSDHTQVNLEYKLDSLRNLIGQPSTLYTVGFAERIILLDDSRSVVTGGPGCDDCPPEEVQCFGAPFISASWYNYENFAYKCNPSGSNAPKYYPNSSNNIGLGRGIFGQRTSIDLRTLKNRLSYGAALGVGALGKTEYSVGDTATGFGAMDNVKSARHNVAVGYKALSYNQAEGTEQDGKVINEITSSLFAIKTSGNIVSSTDNGNTWVPISGLPSTNSFTSGSVSGSAVAKQIINTSQNELLVLFNDVSGSGGSKTFITKVNTKNYSNEVVYSSSIHEISYLTALSPSNIFALDTVNGLFFRSINGAGALKTGSISNISGNVVKSIKMFSQTLGFIVGSKIWQLESGSQTSWQTSSYTGSHTLNAIEYVNSNTWIAVGTSGSIYRTTNKGNNWNYISSGISGSTLTTQDLYDIKLVGTKLIAVGDSGSILISSNNGATWKLGTFQISGSIYGPITSITPIDSQTITAKHLNGTLNSIDGGNTWADGLSSDDDILSPISIKNTSALNGTSATTNLEFDPSKLGRDLFTKDKSLVPNRIIDENVAIGAYALNVHENASKMVAIGANALKNLVSNKFSGRKTGRRAPDQRYVDTAISQELSFEDYYTPENSIADLIQPRWTESIFLPFNYAQIAIGAYAQYTSENSRFNSSMGYGTLYDSVNTEYNTAVGAYSQHLGHNSRNTSLGVWSLGYNGDLAKFLPQFTSSMAGGNDNVAIGYKAMFTNLDSVRARQYLDATGNNKWGGDRAYPQWAMAAMEIQNLASQNIAIGNYAFLNVSGSINTISIGHRSLSLRGYDITDSVFIGGYVGEKFATKQGTYFSSSRNNDWTLTQTVAVGSRALQNQIGHDIVAIGANVLRGTQSGSTAMDPGIAISTDPFGVLVVGYYDSNILSRTNFSNFDRKYWSTSDYVKIKKSDYGIYDDGWNKGSSKSIPYAVSIASRNTAFGVIAQSTKTGVTYPLIVRTDNLAKTSYDAQSTIQWSTVQPGVINNFGTFTRDNPFAPKPVLNTPDENTMYMLLPTMRATSSISPVSRLLKATSLNGFTSNIKPITFEEILAPLTIETGSHYNYYISDMHFPTPLNGIVISQRRLTQPNGCIVGPIVDVTISRYMSRMTTDGGVNWENKIIDETISGSGVNLNAVWMNEAGTIAYAAGNYGSIYKLESGTWTKQLGASLDTKIGGDFWDGLTIKVFNGNYESNVSITTAFATRRPAEQRTIEFFDIKFLPDNPNIGYAVGHYPSVISSNPIMDGPDTPKILIAKTTDGGATWTRQSAVIPEPCQKLTFSTGEQYPLVYGELTLIDQNKAIIGMNFGFFAHTSDGGQNWNFSQTVFQAAYGGLQNCGCNPIPRIVSGDYKKFAGSTITVSGSGAQFEDVIKTVAIGSDAQAKLPATRENVAIGYKVQFNGTGSASASVQIGSEATLESLTVNETVAIGAKSLEHLPYSDGHTAVGKSTLNNLILATTNPTLYPGPVQGGDLEFNANVLKYNTALGYQAGTTLIVGDGNVFVGANSGMQQNALRLPTYGSNNIIIGTNAPKTVYNIMNQVAIGNADITSNIAWGQGGGWIFQSDARDKTDTGSFTLGLEFIRQIQPKEFKWDLRTRYVSGSPDGTYKNSGSSYGYIAQDLESAAIGAGVDPSLFILGASGSYSGSLTDSGSFDIKLVKPYMVDVVAVNAIKQLDALVGYLTASKYTTFLGDGTGSSYPVTHSLGTRDVITSVYNTVTNMVIYPTMSVDTANTITVTFNGVPQKDEYRLVVMR